MAPLPPPRRRNSIVVLCTAIIALMVLISVVEEAQNLNPFRCASVKQSQASSSTSALSNSYNSRPFTTLLPPFAPRLTKPTQQDAIVAKDAVQAFYQTYVNQETGWIQIHDLVNHDNNSNVTNQNSNSDVTEMRSLARRIMLGRKMACGTPYVPIQQSSSSSTTTTQQQSSPLSPSKREFCFWDQDLVSNEALNNFHFERPLWQFVVRQYQRMLELRPQPSLHEQQWAFLDLGVNVADWASPVLTALGGHANFAYYGVEGSPPTASLAAANMLTALLSSSSSDNNNNNHHTATALAYLFPYPLLSWQVYQQAQQAGGVCFQSFTDNVGGQGVQQQASPSSSSSSSATTTTPASLLSCPPNLAAGGAYFPQAAHAVASRYQSLPHADPWPQFFIAKFDIQEFEFKVLSSALEWLQRKPPCYVILEAFPVTTEHASHMWGLWEVLLDAGYDAMWRGHDMYRSSFVGEFPPDNPPYWKKDYHNNMGGKSLFQAWEEDMAGRNFWAYKDYILGFQDEEACIQRIM